jgi:glycosyltransferase involved in cell wall biosynthesis
MSGIVISLEKSGHHQEYLRHISTTIQGGAAQSRDWQILEIEDGREFSDVIQENRDAGHLFVPRLNSFLFTLMGKRQSEITISGIWFGPQSASWVHGGSLLKRAKGFLELYRLRRLREHANLQRLYILNDPATAIFMQRWLKLPGGVIPLSDPVDTLPEPVEDVRKANGIPTDATVFGLIGAHREGKGVLETLEVMSQWEPDTDKPIVLLLAGDPLPAFETALKEGIRAWESRNPHVRLFKDLKYLSREELAGYFQASDYLLMPYRNVYGSSGILGHAARYGKPVLASKGGLIGHLTRSYGIGHTFKPGRKSSFLGALDSALSGEIQQDPEGASRYLENNSIEAFQETLLREEFSQ